MSTARFDTLSNAAGTSTVPVNTVVNGSAKAWVNFNGTGTVAIRASFNVSSITDQGVGNYRVNFTTALADANYGVNITTAIDGTTGVSGVVRTGQLQNTGVMTTTFCDVGSTTTNTTAASDSGIMCCSFFR
jgi:hypothetical protein